MANIRSGQMDLLHGPIVKKVLIFAIPLAITGMLQQLFNAADVAVVGQFCGKEAMAAVGSNTPIVGLLVNFFTGISIGANVVISRFTGQGNPDKANDAVHNAMMVGVCGGFIVTLIGELIAAPIIDMLGVPAEVRAYSILYLRIYFAGMPFIMLYNFESAIFRSQGDTKTPLKCLVFGGVLNVCANLFFVLVLGMSVDGVAIATVLSNVVSSMMMFFILKRSEGILKFDKTKLVINKSIVKFMLKIGVPSGLQSMVFAISNLCVQSAINSLGADVMAASSAAFNIEILVFFVVNAFGQACTTFIGQNYGARDYKRCREIVRKVFLLSEAVTIVISMLILVFGRPLMSIFNSSAIIIELGYIRIFYLMVGETINAVMDLLSGALRGLGKSLAPALVTFFGVCGTRILWVFTIFPQHHTLQGLMLCYPISWAVTAAILVVIYFRTANRLLK